MRFTIGFGVTDDDLENDTLLMGEAGMVNQLDVHCPELPDGFMTERIVHTIDDCHQAAITVVEIESLEHLLELSRRMGRDLLIERQPQEMLDSVGADLPEFCIVISPEGEQ